MKTLLYNPIFVNPQAYYVFPNLNGRLTPQTDTTLELANYIGSMEVKVIAYGDIGKAVYFSDTNYIDLSEFIDSWVRISLYTKAGNVVLGEWKIGNAEIEEPPYIDPEVLESLQGIWIADQNTNDSPTRNIIKNKIPNKGGDFEILNAAYKLDSGYGKYNANFNSWSKAPNNKLIYTDRLFKIQSIDDFNNYGYVIWETAYQAAFKVKVTGFPVGKTMYYTYFTESGQQRLPIKGDGTYELPSSLENTSIGFGFNVNIGLDESFIGLTIEQIPDYKGAFVTDGVDDLIVSQKKTLDIIGDNQPCTVVSMIGFIGGTQHYFNNAIGTAKMNKNRIVTNNITTGIFGYTANSVGATTKVINNILGDKNNYNSTDESATAPVDRRFSVEGYIRDGVILNVAEIAWYWTFIANKVLTTDEINQVIAYYNLDKYVTPDVYYNVKKQGLTNENHSKFGDKLIDYSGNGKDMQLYNFGWKLDSGVGKYEFDFTAFSVDDAGLIKITKTNSKVIFENPNSLRTINWYNGPAILKSNYTITIKVEGLKENGRIRIVIKKLDDMTDEYNLVYTKYGNGIHSVYIPKSSRIVFYIDNPDFISSIEQLPSYEGALVTDGVEDYGQVEGLPIYTDYTVVAERAWIELASNNGSLIGKSYSNSNGAFIVEQSFDSNTDWGTTYSFGQANGVAISNIKEKGFIIQSKHKYGLEKVTDIVAGTGIDNTDIMTFATVRPKDIRFSKLALMNLMLFPYSLSEFLIERQLKKHKAGTLYEGKIEFRPKISSNIPYEKIQFFDANSGIAIFVGDYLSIGTKILIRIVPLTDMNYVSNITINGERPDDYPSNDDAFRYTFVFNKSINKIDITIDKYIRFEDIVQPYPAFFTFYNTETDEIYSWSSTIKVGSTIKIKSITNLLENVYSIYSYIYDGEQHSYRELINKEFVVGKENMNFSIVKRYLVDNNEPKVVLSPERLRLSNETYKLLGYIPDLSGNGNHGVLNNFAYKDMSGEGGYVEDFSAWNKYPFANATYNKITISRNLDANWIIYTTSGHVIDPYEIKVSGIPADGELVYKINNVNTVLVNGINKLDGATITAASGFYITKHGNTYWKDLVIEQLPKYKGSVTFDGVDDYISIPTLSSGGKQILSKINWNKKASNWEYLIDQRGSISAGYITRTPSSLELAYNSASKTYIDGVLNTNIQAVSLQNITHNVLGILPNIDSISPYIGRKASTLADFFTGAIYTFMLFDEISTEEEIKELNEIVGIEGNTNDLFNPTN